MLQNVWTPDEIEGIIHAMQTKLKSVPNGNSYGYGRWPRTEHVGEAERQRPDGSCRNKYLVPSERLNSTNCILHHRMDVGLSYVFTGGRGAMTNDPESLASRSAVFFVPLYKLRADYDGAGDPLAGDVMDTIAATVPGVESILRDPKLAEATRAVCGADRPEMGSIFQVAFVVNVPGQQLATHYDIPFFWGANRYTLPHWLIVAMSASGLFDDIRIRQIQGVAYVHRWNHPSSGAIHLYVHGAGKEAAVIPANSSSAVIVDGSVCQHGVDMHNTAAPVPPFSRHAKSRLDWNPASEKWDLVVGERGGGASSSERVAASYAQDELRTSFVWRHMCFRSREERLRDEGYREELPLESVLAKFEADLRRRGVIPDGFPRPPPLSFAISIMQEYVLYPPRRHSVWPVNPCVVAAVMPAFLDPVVKLVCGR